MRALSAASARGWTECLAAVAVPATAAGRSYVAAGPSRRGLVFVVAASHISGGPSRPGQGSNSHGGRRVAERIESPHVELRGVQALITGGSSGIGRAVALALADAGAGAVAVDYHQREDDARVTCEEIEARGARAIAVRADVGVSRDVERMVGEVVERLGGLGALVNSAGYTEMIPFADLIGAEAAQDVYDTNKAATPLGRTVEPPDVSQMVLSLLAADGITGQTVVIDGGRAITY